MTVYVDNMRRHATVGRITGNWSHLMADTPQELRDFAVQLGLKPEWIQHAGTHREHFDVTDTLRNKALTAGARALTYPRGTGEYLNHKREADQADGVKSMTDVERAQVEAALRSAWYAGFQASRHYPNHSQPLLKVSWNGSTADITANWQAGQTNRPGWVG